MPVVSSLANIQANLRQIAASLYSAHPDEREFARELVRNGRCFVVTGEGAGQLFEPSRFVGYANNTQVAHSTTDVKDGKETNPAISFALQHGPEEVQALEQEHGTAKGRKSRQEKQAGKGVRNRYYYYLEP